MSEVRISDYLVCDLRSWTSGLFRLDAGLADYVPPAPRLFVDEGARLRRRAATWADTQRGKALHEGRIAHCRIGGGIELGDYLRRRLRRRGERMPGVGDAAVNADLFQRRDIRPRRHAGLHGTRENAGLSGFVQFN